MIFPLGEISSNPALDPDPIQKTDHKASQYKPYSLFSATQILYIHMLMIIYTCHVHTNTGELLLQSPYPGVE